MNLMDECVVVPTYKRPELLFMCLDRINRAACNVPVFVFPDRATWKDKDLIDVTRLFAKVHVAFVPDHDYHGNSYNVLEALRTVFNWDYERVYYIEDDVMIHHDFFDWHREQHEECKDLFASMAWIFNRHAPITDDVLFQPWYYAIGTCFTRKKLELVIRHATPRYYDDMQGYIERTFRGSKLNSPYGIQHYEQDGLIQRILDVDRSQTVSPGIAKCTHLGMYGYNRGWSTRHDLFEGALTLHARIDRLEAFLDDPYARQEVFGKEIVEREIGRELPKREFLYKLTLPDGWESTFTSQLSRAMLPKRINSVPLPADALIEKLS